jgi:hypothetical protein
MIVNRLLIELNERGHTVVFACARQDASHEKLIAPLVRRLVTVESGAKKPRDRVLHEAVGQMYAEEDYDVAFLLERPRPSISRCQRGMCPESCWLLTPTWSVNDVTGVERGLLGLCFVSSVTGPSNDWRSGTSMQSCVSGLKTPQLLQTSAPELNI